MKANDVVALCGQELDAPVLISGPTASGKSSLALAIAQDQGRAVINADAIQVFDNWRVLTARPSVEDEALAPHLLYGHMPYDAAYSVGTWLKDVEPLLMRRPAPVIVGGTGLYFAALTEGLADIPPIPDELRAEAMARLENGERAALVAELDRPTRDKIDTQNPMRVQRAWEVLRATGRGLADWQSMTHPPFLPLAKTTALVMDAPKDWLTPRIEQRFDLMLQEGALTEAEANVAHWSPDHPSSKAIGAAELIALVQGEMTEDEARSRATIATRQFAKRQRTWFRARMRGWTQVFAPDL